jgi:hypothetical protein
MTIGVFTTVSSDGSLDNIENPEQWIEILTTSRERVFDHDEPMIPPVAEDWLDENELLERRRLENQHKLCRNKVQVGPWDVLPIPATPDDEENEIPIEIVEDDDGENEVNMDPVVVPEQQPQPDPLEGRRYPMRQRTRTRRFYGDEWVNQVAEVEREFGLLSDELAFLARLLISLDKTTSSLDHNLHAVIMDRNMNEFGMLEGFPLTTFAANANNDDNLNFREILNGPDVEGFFKAMKLEIEQLEIRGMKCQSRKLEGTIFLMEHGLSNRKDILMEE